MIRGSGMEPNMKLTHLANEFINRTFFAPMLSSVRDSQRPSVFGEGPGATTFQRQLDMELIGRMSSPQANRLTEALLRQLGAQGREVSLQVQRCANAQAE